MAICPTDEVLFELVNKCTADFSGQNMHGRIRFKRGKGENIVKPKLHSRIRQSQEFLQRCFHFCPSNGDGGVGGGAGMPIRADEREEEEEEEGHYNSSRHAHFTRDRQWERRSAKEGEGE